MAPIQPGLDRIIGDYLRNALSRFARRAPAKAIRSSQALRLIFLIERMDILSRMNAR